MKQDKDLFGEPVNHEKKKQRHQASARSRVKKAAPRRPQRAPRVEIKVKQQYIDDAVQKNSTHCMIAEAIKDQVPNAERVSVDIHTIRWSDRTKGLRFTYITPRAPAMAIAQWDEGYKPRPFAFRLRGAQVTTMHVGSPGKQKAAHSLGRRKLTINARDKGRGLIPEIIGGRPPPKFRTHREFGMRGISRADIVSALEESPHES